MPGSKRRLWNKIIVSLAWFVMNTIQSRSQGWINYSTYVLSDLSSSHGPALEVGGSGSRPPELTKAKKLQHLGVHVLQPVQLLTNGLKKAIVRANEDTTKYRLQSKTLRGLNFICEWNRRLFFTICCFVEPLTLSPHIWTTLPLWGGGGGRAGGDGGL
jgi:hypothetical protein